MCDLCAICVDPESFSWQRHHASLNSGALLGVMGLRSFVLNHSIESIMKTKQVLILALLALSTLNSEFSTAHAQGTTFTYQGRLNTNAVPANGFYDFEFSLWTNAAGTGTQIGSTLTQTAIGVTNGLFTTFLNFGAVFTGNPTWLAISARSNGVGSYTPLTPLQELDPTPYAITAENLDGTLSASQLTGTLPAGLLSGTYGDALTLNNASDSFTGNGSGLTSLNASDLTTGTVSAARLPSDVAYLDVNQTFTAPNTFTSGGNTIGFIVNSSGTTAVDTNLFTGLSLQYAQSTGESAIMGSYNSLSSGDGFLSFYTKQLGSNVSKQMIIDYYGGVAIDQQNGNNGAINNGTSSGAGLTFGIGSGEGIASKRSSGGNQYGLDFYTGFTTKMSIRNDGFVGIGRNTQIEGDDWLDVLAPVTNGYGGMYVETAGTGLPFYGYSQDGGISAYTWVYGTYDNSWNVWDDGATLTLTPSGQLGVNTSPSQALEVNGNWALIDGADADDGNGAIEAYIGGNGSGSDVQVGSLNPNITAVAFYNWGYNGWMHISCSSITITGGADLAEPFPVSSQAAGEIPQGSVVVIDEENPGHLKVSSQAYDTRVAGVLSGANGINPGIQMQQQALLEGGKNVALTGRVYVLADASNGAIKPGDLLTTSATPGHAMKVKNHAKAQGAILGKAMSGLKQGKGMVLVLVTLQ
jgi:hypothetical protein